VLVVGATDGIAEVLKDIGVLEKAEVEGGAADGIAEVPTNLVVVGGAADGIAELLAADATSPSDAPAPASSVAMSTALAWSPVLSCVAVATDGSLSESRPPLARWWRLLRVSFWWLSNFECNILCLKSSSVMFGK
jgi:hypothetical protein